MKKNKIYLGNMNTGNGNTGNCNTGSWNTGNRNTGHCNTGNMNTGHSNTGDWNTGNWNTGNSNTGNWNTGNSNTGNCNTGSWNTGNRNTGCLNTGTPKLRIFNRETDVQIDDIEFPDYFYFDLAEWIQEDEMTGEEKRNNPTFKVTGGYLRVYGYKEAWRKSWDRATDEDRRKTLRLPNWDNVIFLEITGIDVEKELAVAHTCATREAMELLKCNGYKIIKE